MISDIIYCACYIYFYEALDLNAMLRFLFFPHSGLVLALKVNMEIAHAVTYR